VLDIFRWKTAPSFEVVFRLPAILVGASGDVHDVLKEYSIAVGTAYQVQDDLDDFHGRGDADDVGARRPSIVLAFAHERAGAADREAVADAWCRGVERSSHATPDAARADTTPTRSSDAAGSGESTERRGAAGGTARVREIIGEVGAEAAARETLSALKRTALDALRPLESIPLKLLLSRVTEKILPGA
jgi:hypothetical protein